MITESNAVLASGRATMEDILAKANVRTLDYGAFKKNTTDFINKAGNHDTRDWVDRLARGAGPALLAEVKAKGSNGLESLITTQAGNIYRDLATSGKAQATKAFGDVFQSAADAVGLPPALAGSIVQSAQKTVVDGLGSVGSAFLANAGLGALSGGLSIVAGGLLSLGLGAFFGTTRGQPTPPRPEKRRKVERPTTNVPQLDAVLEEIWTAVLRWRKDALGRVHSGVDRYEINALLLPTAYGPATRRTPNQSGEFTADEVTRGLSPYVYSNEDWQWLGYPIPWALKTDAVARYIFNHDCLAHWIGYNLNLSLATQELLIRGFSNLGGHDNLKAWRPYFGSIGWAEYIVSGFLWSMWRFTPPLPPRFSTMKWEPIREVNPVSLSNAMLGNPNLGTLMDVAKRSVGGFKSTDELLRIVAGDPLKTPRQALAHVTVLLRGSMAVAASQAIQEELSLAETNRLKVAIQGWRDDKLSLIRATSNDPEVQTNTEDVHNQDVRDREVDATATALGGLRWLVPAALGLGAVGLGLGFALSRRR